ncbi:MAG: hypothetical protein ACM32E_24960 [Gemmatimonadota bacterium]
MSVTAVAAPTAERLLAGPAHPEPRTLAVATLIAWLLTMSAGAYMLGTWLARGGLRSHRSHGGGLPPGVIFAHFGLATAGMLTWASYVLTGQVILAWLAALFLMPAIGLGISTVTLWTPYPDRRRGAPATGMFATAAEDAVAGRLTDAVLARALTDDALAGRLVDHAVASVRERQAAPARRPRGHLEVFVPVGHGMGALTTILLAVITAALGS